MTFCGPLLEELSQHHTVKIWQPNPNEQIGWASIRQLLDWCDLGYLEWLQNPTLEISQIQGIEKPLVAFCHGIDVMNHTMMDWRNIKGLIIQEALLPRLMRLREQWDQQRGDRPPLPHLPGEILIQNLGIDLRKFAPLSQPEPEYHIIVHAFYIRPTKGIYTAIQQFHDLIRLDGDKPWKLTLVGDWAGEWKIHERQEYLTACEELIEQLKFPKGRLFIKYGNYPLNTWANFVKTGDVFWCTSWRESFGVSRAEAAASGVYPLLNNSLGTDKLYPEKYLCNTPGEMVEKTIAWGNLSKEEKLLERSAIREHMEKFDQLKAMAKIRKFLEVIHRETLKR